MLDADQKAHVFQRPPSLDTVRSDPFYYLDYDHSAQRALADLLEDIADSLPDCVNRAAAALAAAQLRATPPRHKAIEEQALFPLLERRCDDPAVLKALGVARREHEDSAGHAVELAEALDVLAERGYAANPESLGFMLRAFFDGLRRHMDWVEAAILPQARKLLGAEDVARFGARLAEVVASDAPLSASGLSVIDCARETRIARTA
jgi:hemerythrin-like domain-containing protein